MTERWNIVDERPGSAGFVRITQRTYALPDGETAVWDIVGHDRTVAVLAFTADDRIVLARQFRPGPGRVLDEMPGGVVDDGEAVLDAAARELLEETGYAGVVELAGTTWQASNVRTQRFVAVVRDARPVREPDLEPGEFVEVVLVSLVEFRDHLRSGQLTDLDLGYLALDHLGLLHPGNRV